MSKARIFGYARVSSTDQNLDRAIEKICTDGLHSDR